MRNSYLDYLKGIAIIMVLLIHALSAFMQSPYDADVYGYSYRITQQLIRPAVPLFVAISGFLLAQSQLRKKLPYIQFIKKRLLSLLPLYLLWTAFIPVMFKLYAPWQHSLDNWQWWQIIFLGRADYHLYFVPMLVGLYLLFPFLFTLLQKKPRTVLSITFTIQLIVYILISNQPSWQFFHYDQQFYLLPLSWIFYFVVGIYLSLFPISQKNRKLSFVAMCIGIIFTIAEGESMIARGQNIVSATLTTRATVILYATGLISYATRVVDDTNKNRWYWLVVKLGQWSYLIFMTHTLFLRILQEILSSSSNWLLLQAPIIAYLVGVALSLRLARRRAQ